jgi:hypothetical protein
VAVTRDHKLTKKKQSLAQFLADEALVNVLQVNGDEVAKTSLKAISSDAIDQEPAIQGH